MSIRDLQYWLPRLDVQVLRGFPAQQIPTFRDRIIQFEIEESGRENDRATLSLNNGDGLLLDTDSLSLGAIMSVSFGYPGAMTTPRSLHCKKIKGGARIGTGAQSAATKPHTAAGGQVTMELWSKIWGLDLFRARNSQIGGDANRPVFFKNKTIPEIVREIAEYYGYAGISVLVHNMDDEARHESYTIPSSMSAAEWVQDQAKRRRWVFTIDEFGFHFHPPKAFGGPNATRAEELRWFMGDPDVIEWSVDGDLRVPGAYELLGAQDEFVRGEAQGNTVQSDDNASDPVEVNEPGVPAPMTSQSAAHTTTPASARVRGTKKRLDIDRLLTVPNPSRRQREQAEAMINRGINRWTLNLTLVGNPRVHALRPLLLSNFGPLMDGVWWIRKATHTIRAGLVYQTTVEAKRKAPGSGIVRAVRGQASFGVIGEGQDASAEIGYTPASALLRF